MAKYQCQDDDRDYLKTKSSALSDKTIQFFVSNGADFVSLGIPQVAKLQRKLRKFMRKAGCAPARTD